MRKWTRQISCVAVAACAAAAAATAGGQPTTAPAVTGQADRAAAAAAARVYAELTAANATAGPTTGPYRRSVSVWSERRGRTEKGAFLGAGTSAADATLRDQLQLPAGVGLVVNSIDAAGPAAAAGLQVHDVVTKVDDQWAINTLQFGVLVRMHKPGDVVTLGVVRHGQPQTLKATLVQHDVFVPDDNAVADGADPSVPPGDDGLSIDLRAGTLGGAATTGPAAGALRDAVEQARRQAEQQAEQLAGQVGGTDAVVIEADGQTLKINAVDGKPRLTVTDRDGKQTFDGPIDTPEDRTAVPPAAAALLDKYKDQIDPAVRPAPGTVVRRQVRIVQRSR